MKIKPILVTLFILLFIGCNEVPPTSTLQPPTNTPQPPTATPTREPEPTATPSVSVELKIATWNIEHLRDRDGEGPVPRTPADYDRLAGYAQQLDADIIALQEVDGPEAAARVFLPDNYDLYFSSRANPQRTGFAVRKGIDVTQNPDVTSLGLDGSLRYGTDITVNHNGQTLRLLSVHLKSGCFDNPLNSNNRDCRRLNEQVPLLEEWIDARAAENIPFVVLGDFNRRFDTPGDTFWPEIDDAEPANADLSRVTEGQTSECWNGRFPKYIDHIALDSLTTGWQVPDSFDQLLFSADDARFEDVLSDHCPISVELELEN